MIYLSEVRKSPEGCPDKGKINMTCFFFFFFFFLNPTVVGFGKNKKKKSVMKLNKRINMVRKKQKKNPCEVTEVSNN